MQPGQDFLSSITPSTNLQSLIAALQNAVQAVNGIEIALTTALSNLANPNAS